MKCGSEGTAITRSTGGSSWMKVSESVGSEAKSWERCQVSSGVEYELRICPVMIEGL